MKTKITINIAVAMTGNGGIGFKGGLPWPHLKGDMALFSKRTTGAGFNAVIMGRNTWLSIPETRRPLKNRTNIIISRNTELELTSSSHMMGRYPRDSKNTWMGIPEESKRPIFSSRNESRGIPCYVFSSICDAVTDCEISGEYGEQDEIWVIGGSGIYNEFLNTHYDKVHRVYITYVCPNSDRENYECDTFINIPDDSYLIEEKEYNSSENCYYLTCVHKTHVVNNNNNNNNNMELLEDFIKGCRYNEEGNGIL
jgi:dihydrofolate reductase